jgi:hypothetical protein
MNQLSFADITSCPGGGQGQGAGSACYGNPYGPVPWNLLAGEGFGLLSLAQLGLDPATDIATADELGAAAAEESGEEAPQLVYRGGSAQPANLTPRPGVDATGLSTYDNPEAAAPNGGKVQVIDTSQLKLLKAFPDAPPEGHVSLAPADTGLIEPWAATRGTEEISPFTQDIMDAIIDVIRVPRP